MEMITGIEVLAFSVLDPEPPILSQEGGPAGRISQGKHVREIVLNRLHLQCAPAGHARKLTPFLTTYLRPR